MFHSISCLFTTVTTDHKHEVNLFQSLNLLKGFIRYTHFENNLHFQDPTTIDSKKACYQRHSAFFYYYSLGNYNYKNEMFIYSIPAFKYN